jgi:hypothetical protein
MPRFNAPAFCAAHVRTDEPPLGEPGIKPWLLGGGIWQSGRPPRRWGHVYAFTGNG